MSDPLSQNARMNNNERFNMTDTTIEQLELGISKQVRPNRRGRRENRMARGAWWFGKMRAAVNSAMDWRNPGGPRPEQTFLPGAYRRVEV